ncbi:hypothetical protein FRX31_030747 [Thalictrum thalictroides]|uniref:Uncharacterized protein n=1 Tax=Thalictrum thalictroides TaxID=46969 RepID=A0A7J6V662_THATH|nr:hypothetical protein FRX31_030747 [Thalictrum thalictroides]
MIIQGCSLPGQQNKLTLSRTFIQDNCSRILNIIMLSPEKSANLTQISIKILQKMDWRVSKAHG